MNAAAQDQGARIEAVFAGIAATRMAGVPVLNPALGVAMRGWQVVEPFELGVLVTPWFMNLLAVPQAGGPTAVRVGEKAHLALPSGAYEAIWSHEAALGGFWAVSLFSPMDEFESMEAALATADAALAEILAAPEPEPEPTLPEAAHAPVSRRGLFRLGSAERAA